MAKLLVKKQDLSGEAPFDEQLWPVYAALIVLGGYLIGTILVFCPFDNPWYLHPTFLLPLVPVVVGASMWLLRSFDNRYLRRAIQLSAIVSIIVHLTVLLVAYFMGLLPTDQVAKSQEEKKRPDKKVAVQPKVPEPIWQRPTTLRPRQDFEKPIETATPEPEQKEVQREENKPSERDPEPVPPQPIAVAKPEPTPQPAIERAKEPEVPTPRAAPTQSQLSRNMNRTEAKPLPKEVQLTGAESKQPDPKTVAGSTANVQRQVTEPVKTPVPTTETQPATPRPQPTVQLSQRADQAMQPATQATATPRLERKVAQPTEAPRTNVQVAAVTAKPQETKPDQPRPEVTAATKQSTVAPEVPRNVPTPSPTATASAVPQPVERAEQTPRPTPTPPQPGPQIARSTPNERPTPAQTLAASQPATQTRESPAKVDARDTPIERTVVKVEARPPPTNPQLVEAPQPTPSPSPTRAPTAPTSTAQPTPNSATVARATSSTQPTPATTVAQANPQANPSATAATTPQANAANVERTQPSAAPTVVAAPSTPSPAATASAAATALSTQRAETQPTPSATAPTTPQPATVARATPQSQPRNPTEAAAVSTPQATAQAAPNPAAVAAQAAAIEKSQAEVRINAQANQATAPSQAASTPQSAAAETVARAATPQPTQVVQSTPTPNLERQTAPAALRPTTSTVAQQVSAAQPGAAASESPGPTAVAATKEAGAAPAPSTRVADPSPMTPSQVRPETVARAQPGETSPTLAQTPTPSPAAPRSVTETRPNVATIAAADPSPTRSPSPSEAAEPRAAETSVARQSNPAPSPNPTAGVPAPNEVSSPTTQLARATATRASPSALPSVTPEATASASPLRSARVSTLETSPAPIESPALAEATRPTERPAAEPTRMALSKSTAGVAGIGESSNYDRSTPAPASPAQVASSAARRAEATQATSPGPAISPSQSALVSRSRAGEQAPKSTLLATVDTAAATGGANQPAELAASSSAALTRNSANAKPAEISGAVGSMEVDTGTVQIVSAAGAGRAEGGGQPAMNLETNARAIARSTTGGAPQVTVTATAPGETTTRPATGGGAPVAIDASPDSSSLVKASAGGAAPVSGTPNTADLSGKPADAGAAEVVAAVEAGRATPLNTAAGAPAPGGGTGSPARAATGQSLATASSVPVPAIAGGATPAGGPATPGSSGSPAVEASSAAVARTESGGVPSVGGPSVAPQVGAPAETRSVASTAGGRAASGEAAAATTAAAGPPAPLARAPSGVASLAANTKAPEIAVGSPPAGGTPGGAPALAASEPNAAVAKASGGGGQPVAGGLASAQPEMVGPIGSASGGDVVASTEQGRATATSAASGAPAPATGGGSPARSAVSQAFSARSTAPTIELAGGPMPGGAPGSAGTPGGIPLDATGVEVTRGAAALPGTVAAPGGADAGPTPVEGLAGAEPGAVLGPRGTASEESDGPVPFTGINSGAPLKRADLAGVPAFGPPGPIAVNVPPAGPMTVASNDGTPDMEKIAGVVDAGPPERSTSGALPVALEVPEGPGGLGSEPTPDIGVAGRQAQRDSQAISFVPSRFTRQTLGGTPGTSPTAIVVAEAFAQRRTSGLRRRGDEAGGDIGRPPRATEDAIELGLFFLAQHQMNDGSWSLTRYMAGRPGYAREEAPQLSSDTAATGLSLLCFFGAGYHHQDDRYQAQIKRAIDWLVEHQKSNGDLYVPMDEQSNRSNALYSHAIAAIALCEAYGMTRDPALKEPAQKALDFIVAAQNKDRGGWRYTPGEQSDTSVTGWMVMALKSGELAGLTVPADTYNKVRHWLDMARGGPGQEHLYRYNPYAADTPLQRMGRQPNKVMTAVGMLVGMYTGKNREDAAMRAGADYLYANLPAIGDLRNVQRDTYYWYYATQVMYHMKGEYWKKWNERLHPILTQSQIRQGPLAGSWDPRYPVPDRWGPHAGRIYVTTMNLLSLEVQYRHLPIYEETAK